MPGQGRQGEELHFRKRIKARGGGRDEPSIPGRIPRTGLFSFWSLSVFPVFTDPLSPLPDPSDQSKNNLFLRVTPHYEKAPNWVLLTKSHGPTDQGCCFFIQSPSNLPPTWMVFAVSGNRPCAAATGSYLRWWPKDFRGNWKPLGRAGCVGKCCSTLKKEKRCYMIANLMRGMSGG